MNFLERIKEDLNSARNRAGRQDPTGRAQVITDAQSLRELVHQFELLDSEMRMNYSKRGVVSVDMHLIHAITAAYHKQGRNSETTLLIIMETLKPLIEEHQKELQAVAYFRG